jgi:Fanconi anemia group J protein
MEIIRSQNDVYKEKLIDKQYTTWTGSEILKLLDLKGINIHTFKIIQESITFLVGEENSTDRLSSRAGQSIKSIAMVLSFLFREGKNFAQDYKMFVMRRKSFNNNIGYDESIWEQLIGFWCLNPNVVFHEINEQAHSVILASGTLSPLDTFGSELGAEFPAANTLSANHVIGKHQLFAATLQYGPTETRLEGVFGNHDKLNYQDDLGKTILNIIKTIPGGVLCFISSYKLLSKLNQRWELTGLLDEMSECKKVFYGNVLKKW